MEKLGLHVGLHQKQLIPYLEQKRLLYHAMTKEKVINSLKELPDEFDLEDLFERLLFLQRIEEGIKQSEKGEVFSEAEARQRLAKWLK